MSRLTTELHFVARCVPRHDGGYLITTIKGQHGVSLEALSTGARVVIRDGKVERAKQ